MSKKDPPIKLRPLVLYVIAFFLAFGVGIYYCCSGWEQRGQFGDMFGAVNALFSALAFAVLIYTMWLQREELELQRQELEQTREELSRSADAQEASQSALEKQIELLTLSTQMSAWLKMQEVWTKKDFTDGRARVFARLQGRNGGWTDDEKADAKEVCRRMDEFASLVPFLGRQKVLDIWDDPLAKGWLVLEEIVKEERKSSGWNTKWKGFEELGKGALAKLVNESRDPRVAQKDG